MIWKRPSVGLDDGRDHRRRAVRADRPTAVSRPAGKPCTVAGSTRSDTICVPATPLRKSVSNSASTRFCSEVARGLVRHDVDRVAASRDRVATMSSAEHRRRRWPWGSSPAASSDLVVQSRGIANWYESVRDHPEAASARARRRGRVRSPSSLPAAAASSAIAATATTRPTTSDGARSTSHVGAGTRRGGSRPIGWRRPSGSRASGEVRARRRPARQRREAAIGSSRTSSTRRPGRRTVGPPTVASQPGAVLQRAI